ncbi:MAG: hypothetical protein U9R54_01910 [Bacteroidota bacterium]|nr:hypothetical protein [Bacteroidota bacterium]
MTKDNSKDKEFWEESKKNIESGAKIVGEKSSEFASRFFKSMQKTSNKIIDASSEMANSISVLAHDYSEKYKKQLVIKKLTTIREELLEKLGLAVYIGIENKSNIDELIKTEEVVLILDEIHKIDKEIIDKSKKIEE